jgi:hypothetical protein
MLIPPRAMPIPPRASANELGRANAITSAIVVSFMAFSFLFQIRVNRTDTIKFVFTAIEAVKLLSLGYKGERREHSSQRLLRYLGS